MKIILVILVITLSFTSCGQRPWNVADYKVSFSVDYNENNYVVGEIKYLPNGCIQYDYIDTGDEKTIIHGKQACGTYQIVELKYHRKK